MTTQKTGQTHDSTTPSRRFRARFVAISWRDLAISFGPLALLAVCGIWLAVWLIRPAPPSTLTMTAGLPGSSLYSTAEKYREILARNGVKLVILRSEGSLENFRRLNDPTFQVDVGLVQGGVKGTTPAESLVSLGSVFQVPVAVFYAVARRHVTPARVERPARHGRPVSAGAARARHRPTATQPAPVPLETLGDLRGKRLAIGAPGSGTRVLALTLLAANGITPGGATALLPLSGDQAAQALVDGKIDAVFLTGDSATPATMGRLLRAPGIALLDFRQADAYTRRFSYLNELDLPMGALDLGRNVPPRTLHLVGPTVELIARDTLHPALSDLLLEAAREVNGRANLLQHAGQFPAPLAHEYRISDDATRYYQSGKRFLYRYLPFWLASLADRTLVVLLPLIVILIPALKMVPLLYRWRIKGRIYRWYGVLIALERGVLGTPSPDECAAMLARLDQIEDAVNRMKIPLTFADQFYVLREHIGFVRARLARPAADTARAS